VQCLEPTSTLIRAYVSHFYKEYRRRVSLSETTKPTVDIIYESVMLSQYYVKPTVTFSARALVLPIGRCSFPIPKRVGGWVGLSSWLHIKRVCKSVCLFVCSLAYLKITHVQISANHLYTLAVAVARSSSDGNAIRYVLPVLWKTSCFHLMEWTGQNQRWHLCLSSTPRGGSGGEVCRIFWTLDTTNVSAHSTTTFLIIS